MTEAIKNWHRNCKFFCSDTWKKIMSNPKQYLRYIEFIFIAVGLGAFITYYTFQTMNLEVSLPRSLCFLMMESIVFGVCLLLIRHKLRWDCVAYYILIVIAILFYCVALKTGSISFDTWQVYDTSRFVFKDFGYMNMIRQHIYNTPYQIAFPPLFPVLMALVNCVVDIGIMSSVLLNFNCMLLLVAVCKRIADTSDSFRFATLIASVLFLTSPLFYEVFVGGLSQILGFLFFAMVVRRLMLAKANISQYIFCIVLAGLGVMNRFDFLGVAVAVVTFFPVLKMTSSFREMLYNKKAMLKTYILGFFTLFLVCSPWVIYSLKHFDTLFVTDNGRRLFNIVDTRPSTYFPDHAPAQTLFDNFGQWFSAFCGRCFTSVRALASAGWQMRLMYFAIVLALGIFLFITILQKRSVTTLLKQVKPCATRSAIAVAIIALAQEVIFILTGYNDVRYHIIFLWIFNIFVLMIMQSLWKKVPMAKIIGCTLICIITIQSCMPFLFGQVMNFKYSEATYAQSVVLSTEETQITEYLKEHNSSCLMIYRGEPSINVPRVCSLANTPALISSNNLSIDNISYFVQDFEIDYIFSSDSSFNEMIHSGLTLEGTEIEHLYRVIR